MKKVSLLLLLLMVGCAPEVAPTRQPTLTLMPPTATHTATPVTPTATPEQRPDLQAIVRQTPQPPSVAVPAAAQPLFVQAVNHLSEHTTADPASIQLISVEPAVWTGMQLGCDAALPGTFDLEIEGFRILLLYGDETYEYHTDNRSSVRLCGEQSESMLETDFLLATDPVAIEMVELARRRLAENLDLALTRIQIAEVTAYTWTDSSLGCPQPDAVYPPIRIDGYRIVLSAGDNQYIYHTDSTQLMACEARYERLP